MTHSDFTDEDVARGADACRDLWAAGLYTGPPSNEQIARAVLSAVLPVREAAAQAVLSEVISAHDKRVRAEALREAATEVRTLAVNGENDGLTWTPGNAETEAYNEGIKEAWECIRARADAEEGK
jgi:hypothetical protein